MTEESRGKRRKQANPRRNQVEVEQVSSLASEEEDEVGLWSLEPPDCQESLDKTSLTPSEGTEEPGSPAHPARATPPHSLSPGSRNCWAQLESEAKAEDNATYTCTDREGDQEPLRMYCKSSDSQDALEDLPHFEFLAHLKKASTSGHLLDRLNFNGTTAVYYPSSGHDELPPAIWSPGAQHCSPEGADAGRSQQACPFCHRLYQRGASLRDHVKYCQEWEGGHMVCPLCGYTATLRSQMERHLTLHNQIQDKSSISLDQGMETRKFKCLECGKAFKYKHHLKEHLRIHSGEKPYECSNCKKRFSHSGSYSSHLSSKKCLSGGGHVGGNAGVANRAFNGHSQSSYHHPFSTSPSAGRGRSSNDKGSAALALQNQDNNTSPLGRIPLEPQQMLLHSLKQNTPSFANEADLVRLWDPLPDLPLRAGVVKGTSLLPYLHSGAKFGQMLQDMLHRDVKTDEAMDKEDVEERRVVHNGGRPEKKVSPHRRRSGEGERGVVGVTCRWCMQRFPNVAVLLQHERYLCKINREAVEVPEGFHQKGHSSPPLFFPRSLLQPDNSKSGIEVSNGVCGNKSPLQKPGWHSAPQQLLVAMHSLPPRHDALSSHMYWSSQEKGSPSPLIHHSPELSSPRGRRRVHSSGFSSPAGLDLTSCPPEISSPQREPDSPWFVQNEPLDLSLPKHLSDQSGRKRTPNGISGKGERRELGSHQLGRPSPPSHLPLHQYPVFTGAGPPVFPSSLYNGFPIFSQPGVGLSMHDGSTSAPFSQTANSTGFLSPMPYMMDADIETAWKKIYQEKQVLMGDPLNRAAVDYLSLIDDGFEGEGAPGRKRLKKTDEGLYACDICEKTFQKSSSLLRHKYEHTGKRPHECKICNKAFKHKHHLIEHSRLHSGEKPYQCDKCGKRFSHSGSYSQHMNHRYAYCSKDLDQDQDQEEMPLTPGAGNHLGGSLTEDAPLSVDDTQTAHSFLSDSSLDGALDALKEEEEEEDEEEEEGDEVCEGHVSLSEVADKLRGNATKDSPTVENAEQNQTNSFNMDKHIDDEENNRDSEDQNEDLNTFEMNLEIKELPRIKT
ncbi:zinc finger E-box-binding homeobox 2-like [Cololabis saira]|uniref:zinc finger E-box-binding homeobox 2-like n=1 Tax=Cololabis saira TaxID=129043 RepID=UPI002AD3796E|nr:zinc finger E-box-binding homeobox 2-like [Cololabis saira]